MAPTGFGTGWDWDWVPRRFEGLGLRPWGRPGDWMGLGTACLVGLRDCLGLGTARLGGLNDWDGTPCEFLKLHT